MNTLVSSFEDDLMVDDSAEVATSGSRFSVESVMRSVRNFATLSEALRILGAGVILASMSVFLLQGWNQGNDIGRYLLLLTQTGLLAAAGFTMSHLVRETKGARIFFGLALVSIPANFTILGALLYSVFQWDGGLTTYPGYADWRIEDLASIGATLGGAMVVLLPVTLFCFAIMARHSAKSLSLHFLALNALLLLPIRSSMLAGTIALTGLLYALYFVGKMIRSNKALNTGEGKFALATLFIPLGIILFRSMYFYQIDSLMLAMVSMALFLSARQAAMFPGRNPGLAMIIELLSWPLAMVIALALTDAFAPMPATGLGAPLFAATYAALAFDLVRRTESRVLAKVIGISVSLAVALSFTFSVAISPSAMTALCSVAAGVILLLWAAAGRDPLSMTAGLVTLAAGVYFGFGDIMQLIITSSWIDLAIFGAGAVALGSIVDRHGVAIKLRLARWFNAVETQREQIALQV